MKEPPQNISAAVRKLNPHLYGDLVSATALLVKKEPLKRIRQSTKPLMNKLELEWFRLHEHIFHSITVQAVKFKLGNGIWYKPDFLVFFAVGRPTAYEVKGPHAFRGGFENLKVVTHLYPEIKWVLAWKQDGKWREQTVLP